MTERKVDFSRRPAGGVRGETDLREQALGDPVMPTVLLEHRGPSPRELALPPEPRDESELLKGPEVSKGGRRAHPKSGGDFLEAHPSGPALPRLDHPEGLDLAMGELLQRLHALRN